MISVYNEESGELVGQYDPKKTVFRELDMGCSVTVVKTENSNWLFQWLGNEKHYLITEARAIEIMNTYGIEYTADLLDNSMIL